MDTVSFNFGLTPTFQMCVFISLELVLLTPAYWLSWYLDTISLIIVFIPMIPVIVLISLSLLFQPWDNGFLYLFKNIIQQLGLKRMTMNMSTFSLGPSLDSSLDSSLKSSTIYWSWWKIITFSLSINLIIYLIMFIPLWLINPSSMKGNTYYVNSIWLDFLIDLVISVTLWSFVFWIVSIGEELAWRGYLAKFTSYQIERLPLTYLINGVVWAGFHYPLIFLVPNAFFFPGMTIPIWLLTINFTIIIFSITTIMVTLRLTTDSIIPCLILHGCHNALVPVFNLRTQVEHLTWIGEGGFIHAGLWVLTAIGFHALY